METYTYSANQSTFKHFGDDKNFTEEKSGCFFLLWSDLVENGPVRTSCNSLRFQQVLNQKLRKLIFFKSYEPLICSKFGRWLESSNLASSRTQLNDTWLNVKMNYWVSGALMCVCASEKYTHMSILYIYIYLYHYISIYIYMYCTYVYANYAFQH